MKTSLSPSSTRTPARSSGFTVIEVLVALVILLIGGLAIMNLFPPALNVIKGSENREVAMAQVKGNLARYSSDPASLPDAIYDRVYDAGTGTLRWNEVPDTAVEGSRTRNNSLPKTLSEDDFQGSALSRFKHIVGERHKVISYTDTTVNPPVTRSFVLLNYAYYYRTPDATQNPDPGIRNPKVSTAETIEGARVDENGKLNFADATYASDGAPLPTPPQAGIYYASYSWQATAGGPLQSIADELVNMAPDASGNVKVFQPAQPSSRVVAGPIDMKVFFPKLPPPPDPANPFDPGMPFRGYLPVDPALKGREVVVDYDVRDWRWLVEDTTATVSTSKTNPVVSNAAINAGTARDIKLSVPFLGTPQPTPVTLPAPAPTPTPDPDLYALAMPAPDDSGQIFSNALGGKWTPTVGGDGAVVLDVSSASATYNVDDGTGNPMIAPRVRTSYWASKGWAQQLSVAASSYYAYDPNRTKVEPWREFYWQPLSDPANTTTFGQSSGKPLYFHASEAGKTIMVSFAKDPAKTGDPDVKVSNQIVTIGSRLYDAAAEGIPTGASPGAFAVKGSKVAKAILLDPLSVNGDPATNAKALTSVRGVSVRARTAWQQGSDYTQEVAEMYRPLN